MEKQAKVAQQEEGKLFDKVMGLCWLMISVMFTIIVFNNINGFIYETLKLQSDYWSFVSVPSSLLIGLVLNKVLRHAFD